jgi:hypothetical protein
MGIYNTPSYFFFFNEKERTKPPDELYCGSINEGIYVLDESKKPKIPREIYIGSIWVSNDILLNEGQYKRKLGEVDLKNKNGGVFTVYLKSDEGPNPHFHIIQNTDKKNECCIMILDSMFFDHGTKTLIFDSLKVHNIINEFLNQPNKINNIPCTNWKYMLFSWIWALNNPKPTNITLDEYFSFQQPDYSFIKPHNKKVYNSDLELVLGRKIQGV